MNKTCIDSPVLNLSFIYVELMLCKWGNINKIHIRKLPQTLLGTES